MYDWSEGGDTEVVVEDIERLNMDYWDKYDKQQKDWRMHTEVPYILQYCLSNSVLQIRICMFIGRPGSGSIKSEVWIRILLFSRKNNKKNLDSYCFVTSF
jgi:hypothetical protein